MAKKLKIYRLFNEYDINLEIKEGLAIIIGENGVGKSTILKIINALYKKDLIDLSRFSFEKIILEDDETNQSFIIEHHRLLPALGVVLEKMNMKYYPEEGFPNYELIAFSSFKYSLQELYNKDKTLYSQYLASCYFQKSISKRIINSIKESIALLPSKEFDPYIFVKEILEKFKGSDFYGLDYKLPDMFFNESGLFMEWKKEANLEKINFFNSFIDRKVVYLDMTHDYQLLDTPCITPVLYSNELIWIDTYKYSYKYDEKLVPQFNDLKKRDFSLEYFMKSRYFSNQDIIGINEGPITHMESINQLLKSIYSNITYGPRDLEENKYKLIDSMLDSKLFDINSIINHFYYDEEFLKHINNKAISKYCDLIGTKFTKNAEFHFIVDLEEYIGKHSGILMQELSKDLKSYYQPIIVKESIFGKLIQELISFMDGGSSIRLQLLNLFMEFYLETIDEIKKNKSQRILAFEESLNQIVTNKRFDITPSGIKLYFKKYIERDRGKFKEIINNNDEILLSELSSGEKKLIIIMALATLYPENLYLVDEPEVSFSIVWQEKFLDVITNNSKSFTSIMATHSPHLLSDKKFVDSTIFLPQENGNE